jgi:hypothetical protein
MDREEYCIMTNKNLESTLPACSPPSRERARLACVPTTWDRTRLACLPTTWDRARLACLPLRPTKPQTRDQTPPACLPRQQRDPRQRIRSAGPLVRRHLYLMTWSVIVAAVPLFDHCITLVSAPMSDPSRRGPYRMPRHSMETTSRLFLGCKTAVESRAWLRSRARSSRRLTPGSRRKSILIKNPERTVRTV